MKFPAEHTLKHLITSYDADSLRRLRLSSMLRVQQEAGEQHLANGGLSYPVLRDKGMIFVLTGIRSVIHRLPKFGDDVITCTTWSNGYKGSQFFRCYRFCDSSGKLLAESHGTFALVDPVSFKIMRPAVFDALAEFTYPETVSGCPHPERLKPSGLSFSPAGEKVIRYSDIDYNNHYNNTYYADLCYDFFPGDLRETAIKGFNINYSSMALEGDRVAVSVCHDGDRVYFKGEHDRGMCFLAYMEVEG